MFGVEFFFCFYDATDRTNPHSYCYLSLMEKRVGEFAKLVNDV